MKSLTGGPDALERLDDAHSTVSLLFPGTQLRRRDGDQDGDADPARTFIVAPSIRHPRLLIPRFPGNAAAIVLRSYGGRLSPSARLGYQGLAGAMRATRGRSLGSTFVAAEPAGGRSAGIDDHLSAIIGERVSVAMQLSPSRANRKPVLHVLAADRRTQTAFVKVGTNPLTRRLADQEADALRLVAAQSTAAFTAPTVIDRSDFEGLAVLALSPLPTWHRGRLPDEDELAAATAALAALAVGAAGRLGDSGLWERLDADLTALAPTPVNDRLRDMYAALEDSAVGVDLATGASHGDWSPWNMWQTPEQLLVWDWERFSTGVPIGTDLIHYRLQQLLVERVGLLTAAQAVVDQAAHILRTCVPDATAARVTALTHLLTLAVRYQTDGQANFGARGGRSQDWLLPVLEASLADSPRPRNA